MSIWDDSDTEAQREHNRGQADGAKAVEKGGPTFIDHLVNDFASDEYRAGFKNAVENPKSDDDD